MQKNSLLIKEAVLKIGGTIEDFMQERGCFYIKVDGKRIFIDNSIAITRETFVSGRLTMCKDITHKLLIAQGLPSPHTECFYRKTYDKSKALEILSKFNFPIIIKDASGSHSIGLFPFIQNEQEAIRVIERELPKYRSLIAQEMVFGKEYRVLVLGEKVIGCLEMIPPCVVGDGESTIRQLINKKQKTTDRRTKFNKKLNEILNDQSVDLDSIIKLDEIIYFKKSSCLAEGGEMKDVTGIVNDSVRKICVEASKAVGKYLVGIDVICDKISNKPSKKSFHILEINGKPDLYIHYKPNYGETRNVVEDIVKFMVEIALPEKKRKA